MSKLQIFIRAFLRKCGSQLPGIETYIIIRNNAFDACYVNCPFSYVSTLFTGMTEYYVPTWNV